MIRYWKLILMAVLMVSVGAFFGLWRYQVLAHKRTKETLAVAQVTISQHQANILITEEVANEYQNTIALRDSHIKRLQQRPIRCHAIASQASGADGSTARDKLSAGNGISSNWLYGFASRCEGERLKVKGLQSFINRVYND